MRPRIVHGEAAGFVTDFGRPVLGYDDDGRPIRIPRYGVWRPGPGRGRPRVVWTGDKLEEAIARCAAGGPEEDG